MPSSKTKSNQSTKSSTKSSKGNKNGLLNKINLRSKKAQFLTVILSFALIGGGFMVYRSFAAVGDSLTLGPNDIAEYGATVVTDKNISSKNGQSVAEAQNQAMGTTRTPGNVPQNSSKAPNYPGYKIYNLLNANRNRRAKVCVMARATVAPTNIEFRYGYFEQQAGYKYSQGDTSLTTSEYRRVCARDVAIINPTQPGAQEITIFASSQNSRNVRIANMTIEIL